MRKILFLTCLLLGHAGHAEAATHCVSTTQELVSALDSIANAYATTDPVDLRIRSGAYTLATAPAGEYALSFSSGFRAASYRISGGWNSGCTAQSGQFTVLDGQGLRGVLQIRHSEVMDFLPPPATPPVLRIDNLRFANGIVGSGPTVRHGCLAYKLVDGATAGWRLHPYELLVENAAFTGCQMAMGIGAASTATIRNSLFLENFGNPAAINAFDPKGPLYLVNNTFRRNEVITTSFAGGEVRIGPGDSPAPPKYVTNNIFAETIRTGALAFQIVADGMSFISHNAVQYVSGDSTFGYPYLSANLAALPAFAGTFDHRLAAGSPLRDAGDSSALGGIGSIDLARTARVQGARVDVGAYELAPAPSLPDALFGDGFE